MCVHALKMKSNELKTAVYQEENVLNTKYCTVM